jgi:hypothetical protein
MLSFCGIDVSKDRLDNTVLPEEQCSSVSNDRAGWVDLVERLRGCSIAACANFLQQYARVRASRGVAQYLRTANLL